MSLFVLSSDWRFKELFKKRYEPSYLRLFRKATKLMESMATERETVTLLIVDGKMEDIGGILRQLLALPNPPPMRLLLDRDQTERDFCRFPLEVSKRGKLEFQQLFSQLDRLFSLVSQAEELACYQGCPLIGKSQAMSKVKECLHLFANQHCSVHIFGETGTGKELAANYLHQLQYPHKKIVAANCSLLSGPLGNSMFFGHVKGAYTDGKTDMPGLLQEADQSTLFLDEVENLSLDFQAHLLRLLETGSYRSYGDTRLLKSKFRLITASNEKLTDMVHNGTIRKDFYYRITDAQLTLPPLREHAEDIPLLCSHFLSKYAPDKRLDTASYRLLENYQWPGNVRELFSTLKRCAIKSGEDIVLHIDEKSFASDSL